MHRALLWPEVVGHIVEQLNVSLLSFDDDVEWEESRIRRDALYALATVNRTFCEHALDQLWATSRPFELARLMPEDTWTQVAVEQVDDDDDSWTSSRQVIQFTSSSHCPAKSLLEGRFSSYTRRVKRLSCIDCPVAVDQAVLLTWVTLQEHLFPRLDDLILHLDGFHDYLQMKALMRLINPRMTSVAFSFYDVRVDFEVLSAFNKEFIDTITSQCTGLTTLDFPIQLQSVRQILAQQLSTIMHGSRRLRSVNAPPELSYAELVHLGSCVDLRSLRVGSFSVEGHPQCLPSDSFANLVSLELHCTGSNLQTITIFLAHTSMRKLREVRLTGNPLSSFPLDAWTSIMRALSAYKYLESVFIAVMVSDVEDGIPITGDGEPIVQAPWYILEPLKTLASIECLRIVTNLNFVLQQCDLIHLLSHWSRLQSWTHYYRLPLNPSHIFGKYTAFNLSLVELFDILSRYPLLESIPAKISGSILPDENSLSQIEVRHFAFKGPLSIVDIGNVEELRVVLNRCLPCLVDVQSPLHYLSSRHLKNQDEIKVNELSGLLRKRRIAY